MGSKAQAPQAPDPYQTAGAQTKANQSNAAYLASLNRMNTYGPTGSSTYTDQGIDPNTGAPVYSQQISLSPEQQALYNQNTANQINQSSLAGKLLPGVEAAGGKQLPDLQTNIQNAQDSLYKRNTMYLDPQYQRGEDQLRTRLLNEGATEGSEAYKNAMTDFNNQKQQAYEAARQDAISGATQQGATQQQMAIAAQDQPLNFYNALMGGSQASMPQFGGPGQINTNPADVQGAFNNSYQGQLNSYNSAIGSQNQAMGSLGSILAMMLMA